MNNFKQILLGQHRIFQANFGFDMLLINRLIRFLSTAFLNVFAYAHSELTIGSIILLPVWSFIINIGIMPGEIVHPQRVTEKLSPFLNSSSMYFLFSRSFLPRVYRGFFHL
jgi:hypothetical protein